ncbi:MAG: hypothetical protein JSR55_05185 [Proteobacteria bacterium]|nr:hypothetical protein [Pseudomonadota bacterium]
MRSAFLSLPILIATGALALGAPAPAKPAPVNPEVLICMKAAAATDHIKLDDVDKDACACASKELHKSLTPDDFALHEKMLEVIASGADEKAFNKQMSDIMLKRGMNQKMVDAFLARSKKAQDKAQAKCNTAPPLLGPTPLLGNPH